VTDERNTTNEQRQNQKVFYHSIIVFVHLIFFLFLTFVSCLLTVTLHIVDVRLTCLINMTYLPYLEPTKLP